MVALPTPAREATASMLNSLNPTRSSSLRVLRITALRAFSLRGRPGPRDPTLFFAYLCMTIFYINKNKSDTHRLTSHLLYTSGTPKVPDTRASVRIEETVDVDSSSCVAQAIHLHRDGTADSNSYPGRGPAHTYGHFSQHRYSCNQHRLELFGTGSRRNV